MILNDEIRLPTKDNPVVCYKYVKYVSSSKSSDHSRKIPQYTIGITEFGVLRIGKNEIKLIGEEIQLFISLLQQESFPSAYQKGEGEYRVEQEECDFIISFRKKATFNADRLKFKIENLDIVQNFFIKILQEEKSDESDGHIVLRGKFNALKEERSKKQEFAELVVLNPKSKQKNDWEFRPGSIATAKQKIPIRIISKNLQDLFVLNDDHEGECTDINGNSVTLGYYPEEQVWQLSSDKLSIRYSDEEIKKIKQTLNIN